MISTPESLLHPAVEAGHTGQIPDPETTAHIAESVEKIEELSGERRYELLTEAFVGKHPDVAMQWLRDAGLLARLLPELDATVAFSQEGGRRHKDVWEHTKTVVLQAVPQPTVRWGAVLHDIGKVPTRRFVGEGKVTFHGHAEVGVRMFRRGPAKRICFPEPVRQRVEDLIRYHLRPGQYEEGWTDSAVRRFTLEIGDLMPELLALSRADVTSGRPGKRRRCLNMIAKLRDRIAALEVEDTKPKPLPAGLGTLLMIALKLPPGRHLAEIRDRLATLVEAGEIRGGEVANYYLEVIRARSLLDGVEIREPRASKKSTAGE